MSGTDLGANRHLIGKPVSDPDFATPAVLVDLDALEANIATMADLAGRRGKGLRPHGKTHKSSRIGRMQVAAGASGICCATVREAEVMADAGLDGALVTTSVAAPAMIARLVAAREKVASLGVVVDHPNEVDILAALARPDRPIDVMVDIDMNLGRTGVCSPGEAVQLAQRIAAAPALSFRGVQAYYGNLQHVHALDERLAKVEVQWRRLGAVLEALAEAGHPAEIVSGSGTGTHHFDLDGGPFTELQVGSYLFMDKMYDAVDLAPGGSPFRRSLTVAGRVTSTAHPGRVIVDAGTKALSLDAGPPPIVSGAPDGASYQFMGDEHGAILIPDGAERPRFGDLITLVAPHCDPTINLHDHYHIVRDSVLIDIWPIEARGH